MESVGLIFIVIFAVVIAIPCVGVAWLGKGMLDQLGKFPSRTPAIQINIVIKLLVLESVSWTLLLLFFKILSAK